MKEKIIFLVGPTASGKTATAVSLAKKIKAEIVSCDSMQVYKRMNTITSKPSSGLRKKIPHHLISTISPTREYDVFRYSRDAKRKIKEILNRTKAPLFVGGTGLYMSVLMDGIFKTGSGNKNIRRRLYRKAESLGRSYLYEKLKRIDSRAAARIHPHDTKRIIRALEVFESTGKPISELQKQRKGLGGKYDINIFCLNMQRDELYKRIDGRVDRMFSAGLVNEVKRLLKLKLSKTASCAIGIKELRGCFDGLYDLEEAKRLIKRNTRLYAKRQLTWFRRDKRIQWVQVGAQEKPSAIADRIYKKLNI